MRNSAGDRVVQRRHLTAERGINVPIFCVKHRKKILSILQEDLFFVTIYMERLIAEN